MTNEEWYERTLDWPGLGPESLVVEVGGYEGRWAAEIARRYDPQLYVFEPQGWAYQCCLEALRQTRAWVFPYGLGDREFSVIPMAYYHTDGATFTRSDGGEQQGNGRLRRAVDVFTELGIERIDLMQVNCEGYEFILLPHLAACGWLPRIERLVVQFHAPEAGQVELRRQLAQTHDLAWDGSHAAFVRRAA